MAPANEPTDPGPARLDADAGTHSGTGQPCSDCPPEQLVEGLLCSHRAMTAAHRRLLDLVAELDRREVWRAEGAPSMVSWLMARCKVAYPTARDWVEAASNLTDLPHLSSSYERGDLSFDQLRPLAQVAQPDTDAQLAQNGPCWSAAQAQDVARRARRISDQEARGQFESRRLCLRARRGGGTIEGQLPADLFATVHSTLSRLASAFGKDPVTGAYAPFPQRLADALVQLCQADLSAHGDPERPTVVLHADLSLLLGGEGEAELECLGPVAAATAHRLACDARITVSAEDDGCCLDLGRARRDPTTAQRREIARRDQGCRFPGCGYRRFTHPHHIRWWTNGGATDLSNLVTLCVRDHHRCHEGGWNIEGEASGELTFVGPEGQRMISVPSPTWKGPANRLRPRAK